MGERKMNMCSASYCIMVTLTDLQSSFSAEQPKSN